jgi:CheY-like chemotaxis protein/nitrogen-specific signal transduction histidine kinase
MNVFDKQQNYMIAIAYTVCIAYSSITQFIIEHHRREQMIGYTVVVISLSTLSLLIVYMRSLAKAKNDDSTQITHKFKRVSELFVSMAIIQLAVVIVSFESKPPVLFTHLTPFLSLIICHNNIVHTMITFSGILCLGLTLQFVLPVIMIYVLTGTGTYVMGWKRHFAVQQQAIEDENYLGLRILLMQEIAMYSFFFVLIYHYQRSKGKLVMKHRDSVRQNGFLSTILEHSPVSVWCWSKSNIVTYCQGMNLPPRREAQCLTVDTVIKCLNMKHDAEHYRELHNRVLNGEKINCIDKGDRTLKIIMQPFMDFGIGMVLDISDIIEAEESLSRSEENYRQLVESLEDVIIKIDQNYNIVFVSKRFMDQEPSYYNGKSCIDLYDQSVELRDKVEHHLVRLITYGEACEWDWTECIGKDDRSSSNFHVKASPLKKGDHIIGATLLIIDMSDKIMIQKTQIALEAKSYFIASISHDIRNPIHGIVLLSQLLLDTNGLTSLQLEYIEDIENNSKLLLSLINDVLNISKIESGGMDIRERVMSINDLIESTTAVFQKQVLEKGLTLMCQTDLSLPVEVYGDSSRISQILMNLIVNSIKFTSHGSVTISAKMLLETIDYVSVRFSVKDTGMGISKSDQEKLFKLYTQLQNQPDYQKTNERYHGYGLGLTIVDRLVRLMKGTVRVQSELGVGSEFVVELKLRKTRSVLALKDSLHKSIYTSVLIVTRDHQLSQILQYYMKYLGVTHIVDNSDKSAISKFIETQKLCLNSSAIIIDHDSYQGVESVPCKVILIQNIANSLDEINQANVSVIRECVSLKELNNIFAGLSKQPVNNSRTIHHVKKCYENRNIRILILEDTVLNMKLLIRILQNIGVETIDTAVDGVEGVAQVINNPPYHLIFMDDLMPILGGIEATKQIRALEDQSKAEVPILMLTGNGLHHDIDRYLQAGCTDVLIKPVSMENIIQSMNKLVPLE